MEQEIGANEWIAIIVMGILSLPIVIYLIGMIIIICKKIIEELISMF